LLLAGRRPVVFDELVNAVEYLREHGRLHAGSVADRFIRSWYSWLVGRCRFVLADTDAHADLSAELCRMPRERYVTIPVGTEDAIFYPAPPTPHTGFTVFYYGVMVKLHGLEYFLDAAAMLSKRYPDISFIVGGDKGRSEALYAAARKKGARLKYHAWFTYEQIVACGRAADLCAVGPFGGTSQSQFVLTTKTFQFLAAARPILIGRNRVNGAFLDKKNSVVVPQGDTQALVDAIAWAHDHQKELQAIGRAGRALYERQFSQAVLTERLQHVVDVCRR
jgi:glycosyltransferase involved in cell wall biosynthesis